jgi:hypothetical protein
VTIAGNPANRLRRVNTCRHTPLPDSRCRRCGAAHRPAPTNSSWRLLRDRPRDRGRHPRLDDIDCSLDDRLGVPHPPVFHDVSRELMPD